MIISLNVSNTINSSKYAFAYYIPLKLIGCFWLLRALMDENATGMEEQYSNYLDLYAKWPWGIANALPLAPLQVASEFGKKNGNGAS